jgi:hypothetical protein
MKTSQTRGKDSSRARLQYELLVGIDLGQWLHQACVVDANGELVEERGFGHSVEGLGATLDWLLKLASKNAERIAVAIEKPHGAVVGLFSRQHRRFLYQSQAGRPIPGPSLDERRQG